MSENRKYPAEFVKRVKAEYPNHHNLHKDLDSGNEFVGRYLDDSSNVRIKPIEVVRMIDQGAVQELRQQADQLVRRQKLYSDWLDIAQEMFYAPKRA